MLLKIAMRNLSQEAEKFKSAETGSEKNGASNEDHSSHVSKFSKIKKNKSNEKEYNGNLHINLTGSSPFKKSPNRAQTKWPRFQFHTVPFRQNLSARYSLSVLPLSTVSKSYHS